MALAPHSRLLLKYRTDRSLWHERIVLLTKPGCDPLLLTPAGDVVIECLLPGADTPVVGVKFPTSNGERMFKDGEGCYLIEVATEPLDDDDINDYIDQALIVGGAYSCTGDRGTRPTFAGR